MLKIGFGLTLILAITIVGIAGFRGQKSEKPHLEWFNDMAHQPKVGPQKTSTFFADGRAERAPVSGTVPIGFNLPGVYYQTGGSNIGSGDFTNQPDYANTGRINGFYGDGIPENLAAQGEALIRRGAERYGINCSHCHGLAGKGTGPVKAFGFATIADITGDNIRQQPDGQIFNTITHGKSTMGAHGTMITVEDRWAIVAYVRALQKVAGGQLNAADKK